MEVISFLSKVISDFQAVCGEHPCPAGSSCSVFWDFEIYKYFIKIADA